MLNLGKSTKYVSVFNPDVKEKYVQANLTTSKKNEDSSYANMYWKSRFVGNAFEPAKQLKDKDKIEIKNGIIENTYDKKTEKLWVNVTIFEFDVHKIQAKAETPTE